MGAEKTFEDVVDEVQKKINRATEERIRIETEKRVLRATDMREALMAFISTLQEATGAVVPVDAEFDIFEGSYCWADYRIIVDDIGNGWRRYSLHPGLGIEGWWLRDGWDYIRAPDSGDLIVRSGLSRWEIWTEGQRVAHYRRADLAIYHLVTHKAPEGLSDNE